MLLLAWVSLAAISPFLFQHKNREEVIWVSPSLLPALFHLNLVSEGSLSIPERLLIHVLWWKPFFPLLPLLHGVSEDLQWSHNSQTSLTEPIFDQSVVLNYLVIFSPFFCSAGRILLNPIWSPCLWVSSSTQQCCLFSIAARICPCCFYWQKGHAFLNSAKTHARLISMIHTLKIDILLFI